MISAYSAFNINHKFRLQIVLFTKGKSEWSSGCMLMIWAVFLIGESVYQKTQESHMQHNLHRWVQKCQRSYLKRVSLKLSLAICFEVIYFKNKIFLLEREDKSKKEWILMNDISLVKIHRIGTVTHMVLWESSVCGPWDYFYYEVKFMVRIWSSAGLNATSQLKNQHVLSCWDLIN